MPCRREKNATLDPYNKPNSPFTPFPTLTRCSGCGLFRRFSESADSCSTRWKRAYDEPKGRSVPSPAPPMEAALLLLLTRSRSGPSHSAATGGLPAAAAAASPAFCPVCRANKRRALIRGRLLLLLRRPRDGAGRVNARGVGPAETPPPPAPAPAAATIRPSTTRNVRGPMTWDVLRNGRAMCMRLSAYPGGGWLFLHVHRAGVLD